MASYVFAPTTTVTFRENPRKHHIFNQFSQLEGRMYLLTHEPYRVLASVIYRHRCRFIDARPENFLEEPHQVQKATKRS